MNILRHKITQKNRFFTINICGKLLTLDKPLIMGILNLTDDSFYDGGRYNNVDSALMHAEKMINDGADIIDIGACSTRPGAKFVDKKEEVSRLLPVIREIRHRYSNIPISVDTVWSDVAQCSYDEGADIINDISGFQFDEKIVDVAAKTRMPYILMHTNSSPDKMQKEIHYHNLFLDMSKYFSDRIQILKHKGVKDIILDLGFGFGKTVEMNYELLRRQSEFMLFDLPILTGISRKSMIYKPLNITPNDSLAYTLFLSAFALENGANILRVHDVKETRNCIKLYERYKNS